MQNKFKIISYIKYPDGTFDAPGDFKLYTGDYTKIVEYYNLLVNIDSEFLKEILHHGRDLL